MVMTSGERQSKELKAVGESSFYIVSDKRVSQLLAGNPVAASYLEGMG